MSRAKQNPETRIMRAIREALAVTSGVVVWRNNVGAYGPAGAKVFYGLAPGSADLVGVCVVNPFQVETASVGRFFALEVKNPDGHTSPERVASQDRWASVVRKHGGFYSIVESVQGAIDAVARCRSGLDK